MPCHAGFVPNGVIPTVLLPFNEDLSSDETSYCAHSCDAPELRHEI